MDFIDIHNLRKLPQPLSSGHTCGFVSKMTYLQRCGLENVSTKISIYGQSFRIFWTKKLLCRKIFLFSTPKSLYFWAGSKTVIFFGLETLFLQQRCRLEMDLQKVSIYGQRFRIICSKKSLFLEPKNIFIFRLKMFAFLG